MPSIDQWKSACSAPAGNLVVTADYVGTKGTHLSVLRNLNQQLFNAAGVGTGVIPYPNLGPIEYRDNGGNSNYHGGELTVEKRFSRGFSFRTAYTYSKSIDYAQEHLAAGGTGSFTQNARDLRERRGPSDFDIRHRFVGSYIWELPFGRGRGYLREGALAHILGGWRMSGVANVRSGAVHGRANGNSTALAARAAAVWRFSRLPRDGLALSASAASTAGVGSTRRPTPCDPGAARQGGRNTCAGRTDELDASLCARSTTSARPPLFSAGRSSTSSHAAFRPARPEPLGTAAAASPRCRRPRVMQFALKFNYEGHCVLPVLGWVKCGPEAGLSPLPQLPP